MTAVESQRIDTALEQVRSQLREATQNRSFTGDVGLTFTVSEGRVVLVRYPTERREKIVA